MRKCHTPLFGHCYWVLNVNYIYKVNEENMLYHWSEQEKKFVPLGPSGVGSDEIEYIDGGNASGFNY